MFCKIRRILVKSQENFFHDTSGLWKCYFPSRIVHSKCEKNFFKYNSSFFLGIKIEKHGVKNVFGPRPKAEGRNHSRLHVFQSRYSRKIIKFHADWFSHTLSQNNAWRRMLFRIFWFFHTSLRSILPHFPLFPTISPNFKINSCNFPIFNFSLKSCTVWPIDITV